MSLYSYGFDLFIDLQNTFNSQDFYNKTDFLCFILSRLVMNSLDPGQAQGKLSFFFSVFNSHYEDMNGPCPCNYVEILGLKSLFYLFKSTLLVINPHNYVFI